MWITKLEGINFLRPRRFGEISFGFQVSGFGPLASFGFQVSGFGLNSKLETRNRNN